MEAATGVWHQMAICRCARSIDPDRRRLPCFCAASYCNPLQDRAASLDGLAIVFCLYLAGP